MLVVIGLGVGWFLRRSPSGPESPEQSARHPSGVAVVAPQNALVEGARIEIKVSPEGPPVAPFQPLGSFVSIDATTMSPTQRPTEVALPVPQGASHPAVLVETVGRWLLLPAREERVEGQRVLKLNVTKIPFPWRFVVVDAPRDADIADGAETGAVLTRLEQLAWTDYDRFLSELKSYRSVADLTGPRTFSLIPPVQAAPGGAGLVRDELNAARFAFLKTKAAVTSGSREEACRSYQNGLEHLSLAKEALHKLGAAARSEALEDWCDQEGDAFFGGEWTLEELVQQHCGAFAPWGLELTRGFLADGKAAERGFDVRVLPEFGQLLEVNLTLPGAGRPLPLRESSDQAMPVVEDAQLKAAEDLKLVTEKCQVFQTVQIYSPRLYERDTAEWLLMLKNGNTLYGAVVGVSVIAGGASGGAFVVAAYSVVAPVVETLLIEPIATEAGRRSPILEVGVYQTYDGVKQVATLLLDPKSAGVAGLTDVVLNALIDFERIHWLDELRNKNFGARPYQDRSPWLLRKGFRVPPILLSSNVYGPRERGWESPLGRYKVGGWATLKFVLNYNALASKKLSGYDLAAAFDKKTPELRFLVDEGFHANTIYGTHWRVLGGDSTQKRLLDEAPDLQVVYFALKKKDVEAWAAAQGLSLEKFLSKAMLKVCRGDKFSTQTSMRVFSAGEPPTLELLQRPQRDKDMLFFHMAMAPLKFFGEGSRARILEMNETNVGKFAGVELFYYESEASKRFTFRIVLDKTRILDFPVGFAEMVVGEPSHRSVNADSQLLIEHVYVRPEPEEVKPGRLVWIKDPIPEREFRKIVRKYGDFPRAWEAEITFTDGRPPLVKRVKYEVLKTTKIEFENVEIARIQRVGQKIYNTDTGKFVPDVYLESGNPIWDALMSGQEISHQRVNIRYSKDEKGLEVLTIHDLFRPKPTPKQEGESKGGPNPMGGVPVGVKR